MKIAICEDEEVMAKKLWNFFVDNPEADASYFLNPLDLLKRYERGERWQILFCDAFMEPMDGIALCRRIREYDPNVYIVFVTNYIEYAPAGYEIGLFRYLLKPVTREAVEKVMQEIRADLQHSARLLVKTAEGSFFLDQKEILYLEVFDKETCIHYENETIRVGKGLGELEKQLHPYSFFRIHRKYLVNLERVQEFDQYRLTLDNGKTLPVSRRNSLAFRKQLYRFLEEKC